MGSKVGAVSGLLIATMVVMVSQVFAQTAASAQCPQLSAPLSRGMSDASTHGQISQLQRFLVAAQASSTLEVTGYFAEQTQTALQAFEKSEGLPLSNAVSSSTLLAIQKVCLASTTVSFADPREVSLSASPTLSGSAQGLQTPLSLLLQSADGSTVYQNDRVPVMNGTWSVVIPVLAIGTYQASLSADGVQLATSTLVIGISPLPKLLPDQGSLPVSDVADGRLFRFAIHASDIGSTTIAQLTFQLATDSADVTQVSLYAYTDQNYSLPATTSALSNVLNDLPVDPTASGVVSIVPDVPLVIPPATTYFFELDGTVVPTDTSYTVSTELLSDPYLTAADTLSDLLSAGDNFIWSPNTFGTSATSDPDWVNGSVIFGLGDGIGLTRTSTPVPVAPVVEQAPVSTPVSIPIATSSTSTQTIVATTTSATSSTSVATSTAATSTPKDTFTATPTSGTYPLKVTFAGIVNSAKSCSALTFTLYFADGTASDVIAVPAKACKSSSFTTTHTYSKVGTYVAALYAGAYPPTKSGTSTLLQSQKITVASSSKVALIGNNMFAAAADAYEGLYAAVLRFIQLW